MIEPTPRCAPTPGCTCGEPAHTPRLLVLTGGPSAGKTAVLELARRYFCEHLQIVPESASIVFGGGFWRRATGPARRGAQRAIYHVQRELETILVEERSAAVGLCDRGTLDGLAYWPGDAASFFRELGTTLEAELARYDGVVHLRTPTDGSGYSHDNPMRIESAVQAAWIDERLLDIWRDHPRRVIVQAEADFIRKAGSALEAIRELVPLCCRARQLLPTA